MYEVVKAVDKAGGYVYSAGEAPTLATMMSTAMGADYQFFKYPPNHCSYCSLINYIQFSCLNLLSLTLSGQLLSKRNIYLQNLMHIINEYFSVNLYIISIM